MPFYSLILQKSVQYIIQNVAHKRKKEKKEKKKAWKNKTIYLGFKHLYKAWIKNTIAFWYNWHDS